MAGIGFSTLTNTVTISAGTLTLWYWNETDPTVERTLASAVASTDTTINLAAAGVAYAGQVVQIDSEIMLVTAIANLGTQYVVTRGYAGSNPVGHLITATLYELSRQVQILPFPQEFFGSPASGSYNYSIQLPDVRIAAAELFMTNIRGNSPTTRIAVTANTNQGLRTLYGGQITFQVEGYLAVINDITPPFIVDQAYSVRDIFATLRQPPNGGAVQMTMQLNGADYCYLTIAERHQTVEHRQRPVTSRARRLRVVDLERDLSTLQPGRPDQFARTRFDRNRTALRNSVGSEDQECTKNLLQTRTCSATSFVLPRSPR